jgi:hypothetical protein
MTEDATRSAAVRYEPSVTLQVFRGCRSCGCRHPLKFDPPMPADRCPQCGAPSLPPEEPILVDPEDVTLTHGEG